jgi:Recombinase/Recombinase zinc beta ribbon domain/Resolvase, N terminal domain
MSDTVKITSSHLARIAIVYLRQSSNAQVEHNRESTDRQYALVHKAGDLGWPVARVLVIDEDLGLSGSGAVARSGFARLTAEVALGHVGLVSGLEVSRLARNKAARGELRRGLPVGFVWGEADGEVCFHPDEAVRTTIASIFARFAETGSARRVWLWFRSEGLHLPLQMHQRWEIRWVEASYTAIHHVLSNPVYAGACAYGKTRRETTLDASGARKKRVRHLPQSEWQVLIKEHHEGFIDWRTYEANQARLGANTRPGPHKIGGAVREGSALLQGLVSCGHCGRRLKTHFRGRNTTPGYHCAGKTIVEGRGCYCLNVGGVQIDEAVARTFLAALEPVKLAATLAAAERFELDIEAALKQWRLSADRAAYQAARAERRYRAVDPDNRLVARGLEREWEQRLTHIETAQAELTRRQGQRPCVLSRRNVNACSPSGLTWPSSGMRRRRRRGIERSCCARSSRKSSSRLTATSRQHISRYAGKAASGDGALGALTRCAPCYSLLIYRLTRPFLNRFIVKFRIPPVRGTVSPPTLACRIWRPGQPGRSIAPATAFTTRNCG